MQENSLKQFIDALSSKAPTPGGGGASALIGAVGTALCSMVANLTSGKKKYAEHQGEIEALLARTTHTAGRLMELIEEDARVFEPLARAYGIPKEDPVREEVLQAALKNACTVPMEILSTVHGAVEDIERLAVIGSRMAISDVAVAAASLRSAAEGAVMNVLINTRLMKDAAHAAKCNVDALCVLSDVRARCDRVYAEIFQGLRV